AMSAMTRPRRMSTETIRAGLPRSTTACCLEEIVGTLTGTGLSYRTRLHTASSSAPLTATSSLPTASPAISRAGWVVIAALLLFGGYYLLSGGEPESDQTTRPVTPNPKAVTSPSAITTPAPAAEIPVPLSRDLITTLQQALQQLGFNPGPADGIAGSKTVTAVKQFQ